MDSTPHRASSSGDDGVEFPPAALRLKGRRAPSSVVKVSLAALCGWRAASVSVSTGVTQASVASKTADHWSRERDRKTAAKRSFMAGQPSRSIWAGRESASSPSPANNKA